MFAFQTGQQVTGSRLHDGGMTDTTAPSVLTLDPRPAFARATSVGGATIAAVRADQLDGPTPCSSFTVRELMGHLVAVLRRVDTVGRTGSSEGSEAVATDVADDAMPSAWTEAAHRVQAAWSDDALLDATFVLPWTSLSGRQTLAIYVNEIVVHTWDLATATGQTPTWDDDVIATAKAAMEAELPAEGRTEGFEALRASMPPEMQDWEPPFKAAVLVEADASAIDRLVAFNGRDPHWRA